MQARQRPADGYVRQEPLLRWNIIIVDARIEQSPGEEQRNGLIVAGPQKTS